ncbi:MAG: TonB-dependent receptor [Bacteroidetes bacterium]|nr:MAG: TonB-dependent receptor [Bacteroidota bacterium]
MLLSGNVFAQRTINGTVTDATSNEPLPGVSIVISGTMSGTITDIDGNFTLSVPADKDELLFSMIGYESQSVKLAESNTLTILLAVSTTALDEVVVTGYGGTQKRSKLTNSISTVKEEVLEAGIYSNPAQALSGAVSGLKVTQTSGKPGATPTLVLRGGTNFDGTGSPLVVVDGQVRGINDINPEDIESMEVLKDAGATALYGARANNGVLLITTKRGKEGKSEISLKIRTGLSSLNEPYDFMNAEDYLSWVRTGVYRSGRIYQKADGSWTGHGAGVQANLNGAQPFGLGNQYFDANGVPIDGNKSSLAIWSPMKLTENVRFLLDEGWKTMKDPVTGEDIIYSEFNRESTAFNSPAVTQDYNIALTGGNDRGNYYAGLGYQYAEGIPAETWYQRINFTLNADYKIRDWLTSYSSFNFTDAQWYDITNTSEGNYFARMLSAPPTQREYNANGDLLLGTNSGDGNPLYNIEKFNRDNNTNKFTMSQSLKFDIYKGLNLKLNANWMFDQGFYESFNKDYLSRPGVMNTSRNTSASYDRNLRQTYNAVLNYDFEIENHSLSVLAGSEFYDSYLKGFSGSGSGAPTDDFADLALTSNKEGMRFIDSYHARERILSFFGRANYDFKERYLLSFTFREDGYSRLLGDNRWGFFPGVSGGWIVSREDFMRNYDNIFSFMKLRVSYGLNGNVSGIGPYELQGSYVSGIYNTQVGYSVGSIPNPGLKWEKSNTFETGIDIGFLENKINANFTYYNRLTIDKYANIPLPATSGISSIRSNNGELRNRGVEIELAFKAIQTKDIKWNISANISHNTNTVEKLPDNGLENNRQGAFQVYDEKTGEKVFVGGYQEGQTPGGLWLFVSEGIFKDEAQVQQVAANRTDITTGNNGSNGRKLYGPALWATMTDAQRGTALPIQPGDVNWKDVNGDNVIDNFDRVYVGNVNPKWFGGLSTDFSWKRLTLSARLDYALGFYQVDNIRPWFMGMMQGSFNTIEDTKQTWTPENIDAEYPIYVWADQLGKRNYARESDIFAYEASYLSFREVSLNYNVPMEWLDINRNTALEISVTGQNLGYLTASKLYTPEVSSTGGTGGGYGLPRTIIFGVNLKF